MENDQTARNATAQDGFMHEPGLYLILKWQRKLHSMLAAAQ
jgi:hypothetical protein